MNLTQIQPRSNDVQAEALEAGLEPQPEAAPSKEESKEIPIPRQEEKQQHLDTNEKTEEKEQEEIVKKEKRTGYLSLFRYATPLDRLILLFSTLCAIAAGAALPLVTVSSLPLPLFTKGLGQCIE